MNLLNIECVECGQVLAQVQTPIAEQRYTSTVICTACAAEQMKKRLAGESIE